MPDDIPPIFVSHSHEDNDFGKRLVEDLRAALGAGDLVWYDELGGTHGGDVIWNTIVTEITARPIFIVVVSPDAMRSNWVLAELATAWTLINSRDADPRRRIIPVVYRETELRADLRMLLWIPFYPPATYDASFQRLLAAIHQAPAVSHHAPQPQPPAQVIPSPPPSMDPRAQQIIADMERAHKARDWQAVVDRGELLLAHFPAAATLAVYQMRGNAYLMLDPPEPGPAREALEAALALDRFNVPTVRAAARANAMLGRYGDAARLYREAIALSENDTVRLLSLRDLLPVLDALDTPEARTEYLRRADEALRMAPDEVAMLRARRDALTRMDRATDALESARQLAERRDALPADWIALARLTQSATHNRNQIRAVLDAAAQRFPSDAALANARRELLPPPLPRERFPERLERLGFAAALATDPQTGKEVAYILPPVCHVEAGPFRMGSDKRQDPQAQDHELPQHEVTLPAFQIGKFPVTVAEYACFVASGRAAPDDWSAQQQQKLDHPVVRVSWRDATDYAAWLARLTGQPWKLPSEAEWEKAARWDPQRRLARIYPWGDQWGAARTNTYESGNGGTTPVGSYPNGASPCGAQDMAGNVWEWTSSLFQLYPYTPSDGREDPNSTGSRVLRGGSWYLDAAFARAARRFYILPDPGSVTDGFRVVLDAG